MRKERGYKEVKEEVGGNKGKAMMKISLNLQILFIHCIHLSAHRGQYEYPLPEELDVCKEIH